MWATLFLWPSWVAAALVAAPILSLVIRAVLGGSDALARVAGTVLPAAILETVLLLSGVAVLATAIGSGAAWLVTAYRFPGSRALSWLLALPLAVPTYVTALVYVEILDAAGPVRTGLRSAFGRDIADLWFPEVRSLPSCIALFSFVLYPYVFVAARAAFLGRDPAVLAAARTLGSSPAYLYLRVALPLARPALAAGVTLALLEALNDIGAAEYLGVRTLTVSAYTAWLNRGDLSGAAQIACVTLLFVAALLIAEELERDRRRYYGSAVAADRNEPVELGGVRGLLASTLCSLPFVIGFAVPAGFLALQVMRDGLVQAAGPSFLVHFGTTLILAVVSSVIVAAWAIAIAIAARSRRTPLPRNLAFVAGLGYAVPGTILVLGLFAPLVGVDAFLGRVWETVSGQKAGLVMVGSGAAIVLAYAIRFMRVGSAPLSAQLAQTPPEIEQVAQVLGARPAALAWRVQLPLLRPALGGAALLVFVDCIKELPATLLLRPVGVETLSTLVYGAASRGSFEEGALAALVIVAVGLGPVAWLTRAMQLGPTQPRRPGLRLRPPSGRTRSALP